MLKPRIIPTLLWNRITLVKGSRFVNTRNVGTILQSINIYNQREVDELLVYDIVATELNLDPLYAAIKEFSQYCFVPLTIGGGIKSTAHVEGLLKSGADKICVNSSVYSDPNLVTTLANEFGAQCIVVGIDVKKEKDGNYYCYSHNGRKNTNIVVSDWIRCVQDHGAGEIVLNPIEFDGCMQGYDFDLLDAVHEIIRVPLTISGGAHDYEDFCRAVVDYKVSGVAASSIYLFTEKNPLDAKRYMVSKNILVRGAARIAKELGSCPLC